jgi:hypothetical protein
MKGLIPEKTKMKILAAINGDTTLEHTHTILSFDSIQHELLLVKEVTLPQTITFPVNTVLSKNRLIFFAAGRDMQTTYMASYDLNGTLVANSQIPYPGIERIIWLDGINIAIQKMDEGVGVIAVDEELKVKKYYSFLNKDIFLGPYPVNYQNNPALFWTEGEEKSNIWFSKLDKEQWTDPIILTEINEIIFEMYCHENNRGEAVILFTLGPNLELHLATFKNDHLTYLPECLATNVYGIQSWIHNNDLFISWTTQEQGSSSFVIRPVIELMNKPSNIHEVIKLNDPLHIFQAIVLSSNGKMIISAITKNRYQTKQNEFRENDFMHFIIEGDLHSKSFRVLDRIQPVGIPFHAGAVIDDRILLIHGTSKPVLSIFET